MPTHATGNTHYAKMAPSFRCISDRTIIDNINVQIGL